MRLYVATGAISIAGAVLRKLKGLTLLENKVELELIQGYAACLRASGFGVVLHVADGASVRAQALALTKKKYLASIRKQGKRASKLNMDAIARVLAAIPDEEKDEKGVLIRATYLVGWTLIPVNMMQQRYEKNFMPVNALDCAGMRGKSQGEPGYH